MEKALLKVTRFNNSDVIATSGDSGTICSHTSHYTVIEDQGSGSAIAQVYKWNNGQWVKFNGPLPGGYNGWNYKYAAGLESITVGATYSKDGQLCDNNNPHS